jgi:hypothetical protein
MLSKSRDSSSLTQRINDFTIANNVRNVNQNGSLRAQNELKRAVEYTRRIDYLQGNMVYTQRLYPFYIGYSPYPPLVSASGDTGGGATPIPNIYSILLYNLNDYNGASIPIQLNKSFYGTYGSYFVGFSNRSASTMYDVSNNSSITINPNGDGLQSLYVNKYNTNYLRDWSYGIGISGGYTNATFTTSNSGIKFNNTQMVTYSNIDTSSVLVTGFIDASNHYTGTALNIATVYANNGSFPIQMTSRVRPFGVRYDINGNVSYYDISFNYTTPLTNNPLLGIFSNGYVVGTNGSDLYNSGYFTDTSSGTINTININDSSRSLTKNSYYDAYVMKVNNWTRFIRNEENLGNYDIRIWNSAINAQNEYVVYGTSTSGLSNTTIQRYESIGGNYDMSSTNCYDVSATPSSAVSSAFIGIYDTNGDLSGQILTMYTTSAFPLQLVSLNTSSPQYEFNIAFKSTNQDMLLSGTVTSTSTAKQPVNLLTGPFSPNPSPRIYNTNNTIQCSDANNTNNALFYVEIPRKISGRYISNGDSAYNYIRIYNGNTNFGTIPSKYTNYIGYDNSNNAVICFSARGGNTDVSNNTISIQYNTNPRVAFKNYDDYSSGYMIGILKKDMTTTGDSTIYTARLSNADTSALHTFYHLLINNSQYYVAGQYSTTNANKTIHATNSLSSEPTSGDITLTSDFSDAPFYIVKFNSALNSDIKRCMMYATTTFTPATKSIVCQLINGTKCMLFDNTNTYIYTYGNYSCTSSDGGFTFKDSLDISTNLTGINATSQRSIFVGKLNTNLEKQWITRICASGGDCTTKNIMIDNNNRAVICGDFTGTQCNFYNTSDLSNPAKIITNSGGLHSTFVITYAENGDIATVSI